MGSRTIWKAGLWANGSLNAQKGSFLLRVRAARSKVIRQNVVMILMECDGQKPDQNPLTAKAPTQVVQVDDTPGKSML